VTAQLENQRQRIGGIFIVIDDQNTAGRSLEIGHADDANG